MNVYNVLAACAAAYARGCTPEQIARGHRGNRAASPDASSAWTKAQPFAVVVDYAHTDDALKNLTRLARDFASRSNGRVITVFGCGGDRDRTKRPKMGRAAGEGSDFVVVTSDNPRSEDPSAIIEDAMAGLREAHGNQVAFPPSRTAARPSRSPWLKHGRETLF